MIPKQTIERSAKIDFILVKCFLDFLARARCEVVGVCFMNKINLLR